MKFRTVFAICLFATVAHAEQPEMPAPEAVDEWRAANWTCESGQDHDGEPVDLKEVKAACVSMGILTAKLSQAGFCYDAKTVEWAPC